MKLQINGGEYAVTGNPAITAADVRIPLAEAPEAVTGALTLRADDGTHLRTWAAADFLRSYIDGTTLVLTQTPEPEIAPERTLPERKAAKLTEINAACDAAIAAGCDVTLSDGTAGHITLTLPDQINLTNASGAIAAGKTGYAYHLDGALCEIYGAADIAILAAAATAHVLYHQTFCNHVRAWVNRCTAAEEVEAITYGAALPDDLAAHMAAVLAAAGGADGASA